VNNKAIVFISYGGKSYSDNPKAISEKLHEIRPDLKIIWLFNKPETKKDVVPEYVSCLKANTFKALKALATSKFWIDNFEKPIYIYKSRKQFYLQTWHGDRGFKKVLHDSLFASSNNYRLFESKSCDLIIVGSEHGEKHLKSAFKYTGDFLKRGCPRNDILVENNPNKYLQIKGSFSVQTDTKILLYAPTFRRESSGNNAKKQLVNIDLTEVVTVLENVTNENWICLVRAHSAASGLAGIPDDNRFIDVTNYEDMSELLLISDILITDYSTCAGDFALLNRPVILYQSDREEYIEKDRTFYFDIDKSPFIVAMNQSELISFIKNINTFDAKKNCEEILRFYGSCETGKASEAVVNYIISKIEDDN